MTAQYDALYARYALPAGAAADAADALAPLVAANLDGRVFRRELVRLTDERRANCAHGARSSSATSPTSRPRSSASARTTASWPMSATHSCALPDIVQKYLLKQAFRDRR